MADVIATIVIVLLFTVASVYIYKEKKKGSHCIGCPMAKNCARAIPKLLIEAVLSVILAFIFLKVC